MDKISGGGYLICNTGYVLWLHGSEDRWGEEGLKDYKFYCFNGTPKYLYVSENMDCHEKARISFLDMDYKKAPFGRDDYKEFDIIPQ